MDFETIVELSKVIHIVYLVFEAYEFLNTSSRRWWVRPAILTRDELGFFETCIRQLQSMDNEHFYKATRMSVEKFKLLLTLLRARLQKHSHRKPIDPETRLAVTILYLTQGCNFHFLAWAYKIGVSTVREIVYETCNAIWEELHAIYLALPNEHEWNEISKQFYCKTGMPHCIGAIEGKLINIVRPRKSGSLYFDYKKKFSIILLAACDANYTFTFVDVGAVGSQSDSGVLTRSAFGRKLLNNQLNIPNATNLPGSDTPFPFYFVGDNAFPLRNNIMRPFPGISLPIDKRQFNETLPKARVHIEQSFGILANRWRILHSSIHACPKNVDKIVLAAVVLHNYLMLEKDSNYSSTNDQNYLEASELQPIGSSLANRSSSEAFEYRNILKSYLRSE